ncbi:MAG: hypothetical protein M0026_03425 [Nocardiopsaceae bacterium]|nr:hypothetical protein [Nocardiopsaceae bacterium]
MSLLGIREAVVASTDVPAATAFHREAFGLEVLDGAPTAHDGVLLGVAGSPGGRLRLVPTTATADPPPALWDYGARLLGIYSRDLAGTAQAMRAAGGEPRDPVSYAYGTATMTELVGRGTDGIWWTIPQVTGDAHRPSPALWADSERRHSELHTAVLVVEDHQAAVDLFTAAGMRPLFDAAMTGEEFERLVGMPAGASLRLAFMIGPEGAPARLEIMSFTGVEAADRTADRVGIQRLVFTAEDPAADRASLVAAGAAELPDGDLQGPAGVRIALVAEESQ